LPRMQAWSPRSLLMSGVIVMEILHQTVVIITVAVRKSLPELQADLSRIVLRVSPATAHTRHYLLTPRHPAVVPRVSNVDAKKIPMWWMRKAKCLRTKYN
jgi:hypothetical protein